MEKSEIYVGLSGGRDSVAALLWVLEHPERFGGRVAAVHFNHHLRGEASDRDEAFCREFCRARNVPCRVESLDVAGARRSGESVEMTARRLRLARYHEIAGADVLRVVLGHHKLDRRENLFLRLARGGNVSALTSLRSETRFGNLVLLRPLLDFDRVRIQRFLADHGVTSWCEDATNGDVAITRNFIRLTLMADFARISIAALDGLDRALEALDCDASFIENAADQAFAAVAGARECTPLDFWRELHPALRHRVLGRYLRSRFGTDFQLNAALSERFGALLASGRGRLEIPGTDAVFSIRGQDVNCLSCRGRRGEAAAWAWRQEPECVFGRYRMVREYVQAPSRPDAGLFESYFDADQLPSVLEITGRREGDRMKIFGSGRVVKLKKLRIDRALGADEDYPLVRAAGEIIFAPGIRHGAAYAVTPETRKTVRVSLCELQER